MSLSQSLAIVMQTGVTKHRGINIYKEGDKYTVFGSSYPTEYLAKKKIDLAYNKFNTHKIVK